MEYGKNFQEDDVKISLRNLSFYCKSKDKLEDINFFLKFYTDTCEVLKVYALATRNLYITEKLKQFPTLDYKELDYYLNGENRDFLGFNEYYKHGWFAALFRQFFLFFQSFKNRNVSFQESSSKLDTISSMCEHILFLIENPMFGQVAYEKEIES